MNYYQTKTLFQEMLICKVIFISKLIFFNNFVFFFKGIFKSSVQMYDKAACVFLLQYL